MVNRRSHASQYRFQSSRKIVALALAGGALLVLLLLVATPHGIGVSPDSVLYFKAAENLRSGDGFSQYNSAGELIPVTIALPFYPLLLAVSSLAGGELAQTARLLNGIFLAALATWTAFVLWKLTSSKVYTILGTLGVITAYGVLQSHLMAWTEVPFLLFTLVAVYLVATNRRHGMRRLLLAALVIGMALLTRYVAVALLIAAAVFLLIDQVLGPSIRSSICSQIRTSVSREGGVRFTLLIGVSSLPLMLWFLRNMVSASSLTGRVLVWHPIGLAQVYQGFATISQWALPGLHPVFGFIFVLLTASLVQVVPARQGSGHPLLQVSGLFALAYLTFLVLSISVIDAYTPVDVRTLAPLQLFWLIWLTTLLASTEKLLSSKPFVRLIPFAVMSLIVSLNVVTVIPLLTNSMTEGLGYSKRVWRSSETVAYLRTVPEERPICSNGDDVIHLYTGRYACRLPAEYSPIQQRSNPNFSSKMRSLLSRLAEQRGMVVYFDSINREYLPEVDELLGEYSLTVVKRTADGIVLAPGD